MSERPDNPLTSVVELAVEMAELPDYAMEHSDWLWIAAGAQAAIALIANGSSQAEIDAWAQQITSYEPTRRLVS